MNNYYDSKYTHQYYIMEVCNCSNDRQWNNNESMYLYLWSVFVSSRKMTSHIVHQPYVGQFQSIYCIKISKFNLKSHLNMLLLLSITVDIYKKIYISILVNKQNNDKI